MNKRKMVNVSVLLMLLVNTLIVPAATVQGVTESEGVGAPSTVLTEPAETDLATDSEEDLTTPPVATGVEEVPETEAAADVSVHEFEPTAVDRFVIIKESNFYIYSAPFGTAGSQRLERVRDYAARQGTNAHITQETTTTAGVTVWYIANVGWVDYRAFEDYPFYVETVLDEHMAISNQGYYVYSAPFGTYGAKRVRRLSEQVALTSLDVHVTKYASGDNGVEVYYLAEIGWVDHRALTPYATLVGEAEPINDYMKITNPGYYLYNEPFGTRGSKRVRSLKEQVTLTGEDVYVEEKATTTAGVTVYKLRDLGWVDYRALAAYATLVGEAEPINDYMKITNSGYYLYNEPFGTRGSKRVRSLKEQVALTGEAVYVEEKATTTAGVTVYKLRDLGWVDHRALSAFETLVGVPKQIAQYMKIENQVFYIYSQPYGTKDSKRVRSLKEQVAISGEDVYVEEEVTTSAGVTVYKLRGLGWVDHRSIVAYETLAGTPTPINQHMRIANQGYYVYAEPFGTRGATRVRKLDAQVKLTGRNFYVTKKAVTTAGVTVYYAQNIGWMDHRALEDYDTVEETKVNLSLRIVNQNYYIYNKPYGTEGAKREKSLKTHVTQKGHNVTLTKKGVTSAGVTVYYAEGIGWLDHRAVGPYATIGSEKKLNKQMAVANQGYYIYSHPYGTKNFLRGDKLSTYVKKNGKSVYATKEVTTSEGIKVTHLRNVGWVDSRALIDGQQAKLNKVQSLLNRKYNSSAYGIQVTSLADGSSAGMNANTRFTAASTGKLPAIYYTQKKISTGQINAKKQFLYTDAINRMPNSYMRGGAGVLQGQPFGRTFPLDQILNWTIKHSDNQGTNFIAYHAADKYDSKMRNEISGIIGRTWDTPFSITAKENALLMEAIYKQGGQSITYLQKTDFDNQRIPKYLPVKVAHKIGDVYDYRHDIAIVYAKEPYILSVMTKGRSYENISILSKEVYDIMK